MKVFVKETDLVIGGLYYLPNRPIRAFFIGCIEEGPNYWSNWFYPLENARESFFVEDDGTVGFSMDNDDNFVYEEVE